MLVQPSDLRLVLHLCPDEYYGLAAILLKELLPVVRISDFDDTTRLLSRERSTALPPWRHQTLFAGAGVVAGLASRLSY